MPLTGFGTGSGLNELNNVGRASLIYLITAIVAGFMVLFDKTIQSWQTRGTADEVKERRVARAQQHLMKERHELEDSFSKGIIDDTLYTKRDKD